MDFTEVTIIAEQLYRKRAECLFKMVNHSSMKLVSHPIVIYILKVLIFFFPQGKYLEAIQDCEQGKFREDFGTLM